MFPFCVAKCTFQSFQRIAFSSPPCPKYKISARGPFFASPLRYGMKLYPSACTLKVLPLA